MMNQEVEQEGTTTSTSRIGWGRRSRGEELTAYDEIEQFNDVGSTEDASAAASASEYMMSNRVTAPPVSKGTQMGNVSYGGSGAPCGACKFLRRKCVKDCVFAPYFGAEHGAARFAAVHKIFGASNVNKLLRSIPAHKRCDAVITISYEAQARITNPVYGCVAAIADLQQQVQSLQTELNFVHTQLANSRELAAVSCMALQQQQQGGGGHAGCFLPFNQTQPLDPAHMQHLLCPQIPSPPTIASYSRAKEELENPLRGIPHLFDNIPMGNSSNSNLTAADHMQQAPHDDLERHHHHLSIDLIDKNEDIPAPPSSDPSHLHALLRTRCLNLHEAT